MMRSPSQAHATAPAGDDAERRIVDSWQRNTGPWTAAVREGRIDSRVRVTDRAIVDAVLARSPRHVLDIGCGEGWLARALAAHGVDVHGIDVVAELIARARESDAGHFEVLPYAAIGSATIARRFDACVCNFSLLGAESAAGVVAAAPELLEAGGALIVQTLHPLVACGDAPYRDGWREGSWAGFGDAFSDPAPWYFRTLESWVRLFGKAGLHVTELREPLHPDTGKPVSMILVGTPRAGRTGGGFPGRADVVECGS